METIEGSGIQFDMVWIEAGEFWIGRTEVTWDEFLLYCDFEETEKIHPGADAVSKPSKPLSWTPYDHDWGTENRPAIGMSWNSSKKYCQWLSLNSKKQYRLPTEDEWQLACGTMPPGPLPEHAWFAENSNQQTQPIRSKEANEFGLYDMLGNAWEYCQNPYSDADPEQAVLRGGGWSAAEETVSNTYRLPFNDDWTLDDPNFPPGVWWIPEGAHLGFRVLRPGPKP